MHEGSEHFIIHVVNPGHSFPDCPSECVMCPFWHCPSAGKLSISRILRDGAESFRVMQLSGCLLFLVPNSSEFSDSPAPFPCLPSRA